MADRDAERGVRLGDGELRFRPKIFSLSNPYFSACAVSHSRVIFTSSSVVIAPRKIFGAGGLMPHFAFEQRDAQAIADYLLSASEKAQPTAAKPQATEKSAAWRRLGFPPGGEGRGPGRLRPFARSSVR